MKKILVTFSVVGLLLAGCSKEEAEQDKQYAETTAKDAAQKTKDTATAAAAKAEDAAANAKNAIANRMAEWKLTPDDIKNDFQKSGRIVREKSKTIGQRVGESIDDARIVTVVKGKYLSDDNLSAIAISVSSDKGVVTLTGSVKSLELVGRASALALDTEGVSSVVSLLRVTP